MITQNKEKQYMIQVMKIEHEHPMSRPYVLNVQFLEFSNLALSSLKGVSLSSRICK